MSVSKDSKYNHLEIENLLIQEWERIQLDKTPILNEGESKYYSLYSFPYPSGSGLHVGHAEGMVANDIMARYYRMNGRKVTLPMGWDAFGLPAENYAIKTGTPPQKSTDDAITTFINQIKRLGISVDWEKEVGSHRPDYYKWTQWFFSKLYEYGLAYKGKATVNWCPKDMTVLANEQVVEGKCERCDSVVDQKEMDQWFFKITDYADRLISGLEKVDWPNATKQTQINWIGKSEGAEILFPIYSEGTEITKLKIFTTAHDTIMGATFMVVAPEHEILKINKDRIKNYSEIYAYVEEAKKLTNLERQVQKDKTGIKIDGLNAKNPLNGKDIPIYVADYVLNNYGTGAIMAVPGHDERDFAFAKKYGIEIIYLVDGHEFLSYSEEMKKTLASYQLKNSGQFDGMNFADVREKIITELDKLEIGTKKTEYKLRDWLISRQRYWGAPIPMIWKERRNPDKVLMIHGIDGHGEENWFPWLKENVNGRMSNIECLTPNFSSPKRPVLGDWLDIVNQQKLSESSSIVGHSSGGFAALKYAETHKLKQLVLVAPPNTGSKAYWEYMKSNYSEFPVDFLLENFYSNELKVEDIVKNVEEIVFIFSSDDPYITEEIREQYKEQFSRYENVQFRTFLNRHHFGTEINCKAIPELMEYFGEKQFRALFEKDLPIELPTDVDFIPEGYSPLSRSVEYSRRIKEKFGQEWTPEFDTMDTFVCSSWYYFRFIDSHNANQLANSDEINKWMPVDLYMIGAEHTVLHLMYSRFFTKFLFDIGVTKHDEPFQFMRHMGIIRGSDNRKMSKRWGNVINPNDVVDQYGADTLRMYEMFMGPIDQGKAWSDSSVQGVRRFLDRVYAYSSKIFVDKDTVGLTTNSDEVDKLVATLVKEVDEDTKNLRFNTAVSEFMKFMNGVESLIVTKDQWSEFLRILAPYAPFMSEYIWQEQLSNSTSIHLEKWPNINKDYLASLKSLIGVQVNGKRRGEILVDVKTSEEEVIKLSLENEQINKYIVSGYKKLIYIPGKIVNFIV
jgi:leucyl-tRNA synthetase/predicted alpha/beta hydrolase family esterase